MDSFYDQPRRPPLQQGIPTTNRLPSIPSAVPDASMLLQNTGNIPPKKSEMSYNAWKYQIRGKPNMTGNKENATLSKESLYRKQVRFESPQTMNIRPHVPNFNVLPMRPTLVNKQHDTIRNIPTIPEAQKGVDQFLMPRNSSENKILQAKPFEKMYMANVPNRNLDLSIIEPPRGVLGAQLQRSNSAPEPNITKPSYSPKYTQTHENSIRTTPASSTTLEIQKPESTTNSQAVQKPTEDEPSVKDLLKIIQQQNQQLMCLQEQVSSLLKERSQQPQIEATPPANHNWQEPVFKNKILDNVLNTQGPNGSPRANKFAIDVMTSFEVSIRPPNGRFNGRRFSAPDNGEYGKATLTEILDDSKTCKTDLSLKLDEPVVVDERCPSPENSIHVDMKDFSSDEEDASSEELNNSMIGWTIYNNVMDQVNFMLHKSAEKQGKQPHNQQYTGAIMKQVKEATLKHLQKVGVDLNNIEEDITVSTDAAYSPTEVSFAVKQLLMKYLPDEQLAKLTVNNQPASTKNNLNYPIKLIKRRPDFSMATVQYMKKYNLLNCESNNGQNLLKQKKNQPAKPTSDKMLDITALKQQPKLL